MSKGTEETTASISVLMLVFKILTHFTIMRKGGSKRMLVCEYACPYTSYVLLLSI